MFHLRWPGRSRPRQESKRRRSPRCRPELARLEERTSLASLAVTAKATPNILPPSGRYVPVTVSGLITEPGKTPPDARFQVVDEYRRVEPARRLSLKPYKKGYLSYSFTIYLQAWSSAKDPSGRHYYILVAASDSKGSAGKTIPVVVPNPRAYFAQGPRR